MHLLRNTVFGSDLVCAIIDVYYSNLLLCFDAKNPKNPKHYVWPLGFTGLPYVWPQMANTYTSIYKLDYS
jgi:hypothetical protein